MDKTELLNFTKEKLVDMIYKSMCDKDNLIKYLENKIKEPRIGGCDCLTNNMFETEKRVYKDILERVKSGKYE